MRGYSSTWKKRALSLGLAATAFVGVFGISRYSRERDKPEVFIGVYRIDDRNVQTELKQYPYIERKDIKFIGVPDGDEIYVYYRIEDDDISSFNCTNISDSENGGITWVEQGNELIGTGVTKLTGLGKLTLGATDEKGNKSTKKAVVIPVK